MQGLKNLFSDAHGLAMLMLITAASVLAGTGKMTIDQWTAFSQWIFAAWMGGHAVITATSAFAGRNSSAPTPAEDLETIEAPAPLLVAPAASAPITTVAIPPKAPK